MCFPHHISDHFFDATVAENLIYLNDLGKVSKICLFFFFYFQKKSKSGILRFLSGANKYNITRNLGARVHLSFGASKIFLNFGCKSIIFTVL